MQTPPPVCQAPPGSCDAAPPPPNHPCMHTLHPTSRNLRCRLFCFPRCLIFCTEHSFVSRTPSLSPFFFCLQLFCHSNRHSLTLLASHDHLVATALCLNPLPDVTLSGTDLNGSKKKSSGDFIDLHLWLISCIL